ncbi:heme lyase CcmF/NrfE family subunit [Calidifontibacillus erzurumensis]|uniref:Heme lyase CcmF/NrfE family subunit n=1 Tax=Calidifontibacillus erzurumensis TaxID=2741433 RepID=A0A8J8KAM0_9BACI|nr:heme lyase CcmF/NrfE family subunit [Calidifontibacillus erzurumensis]NSL50228.1 heme lyase CcmF/NrfE family subunit [Calidifontibacillus erzurumensis]
MYVIGNVTLYLGLILSVYALFAFLFGAFKKNEKWINSGKNGVLAIFLLTTIAMAILLVALATSQFKFKYVSNYTNLHLPLIYKLCALWAGNAGSLLLWTFFLTLYTALITFSRKMKGNKLMPYIASILLGNTLFFYFVMAGVANPFELNEVSPIDGNGLNPMLQHPGMILHPLTLYLGYVGLAVPFAFAISALILKTVDSSWIRMTRRWTLIAWLFLTLGNVIGGRWAYMELGWGGYWAWDPVENASFMPWLTTTAFLHSVMIQERKQMLKVWNVSLIIISYALTLFGTFLVRSGILTSVHSFTNSNLGLYFLIFMAIAILFALYMLMSRFHLLKRDSGQFESFLSKESSFLVNNLILVGAAFAVFWGTIFPLVSEAVNGVKVKVGIPYFNSVMSPLLLALLFIMAICPLIAWQKSSKKNLQRNFLLPSALSTTVAFLLLALGIRQAYPVIAFAIISFMILTHLLEIYRGVKARHSVTNETYPLAFIKLLTKNRRRYGGYIVHIGIAFIAIGIVGSQNFQVETMKTMAIGESIEIEDYKITYDDLGLKQEGMNDVIFAVLTIKKDGKNLGKVMPEKIFYSNWEEPSTEVGLLSRWDEDLYTVISSWEQDRRATFVFRINPLVKWIWFGSFIVVIGTIFALFGRSSKEIVPKYFNSRQVV